MHLIFAESALQIVLSVQAQLYALNAILDLLHYNQQHSVYMEFVLLTNTQMLIVFANLAQQIV